MDALTFGTAFLLRGFNSKKEPITQIDLSKVLEGFEMTMDQFIDLCILCGCDYTCSIQGVGPVKAFNFIKSTDGTIEQVIDKIAQENQDPKKKTKYQVSENFMYKEARQMFKQPDVLPAEGMKFTWEKPDEEVLKKFLIEDKAFAENRIESGLERLKKSLGKANQGRIDSFFKAAPSPLTSTQKKPEAKGTSGKKRGTSSKKQK